MTWIEAAYDKVTKQLQAAFPVLGAVGAAKDVISEAVASRIRDEAVAQTQALLTRSHRSVLATIAWQNGVLMLSLLPVYFLHSPLPFYAAYAGVAAHSFFTTIESWPLIRKFMQTRSVTETLAQEVFEAIEKELVQKPFYERKVVEWLGPDLRQLSQEVARKLRTDVIAAMVNMGFTVLMAFVAFRVFAIPLLEQRALGY